MSQESDSWTTLLHHYADVSLLAMLRIVQAADTFWYCQAAFPDQPQHWQAALTALDEALSACPGTGAAHSRWQQLAANLRKESSC